MRPHWHVLGAGAMGCLFSSFLHRAGCSVSLLVRQRPQQAVTTLLLESGAQSSRLQLPVSFTGDQQAIAHLLVTTKAYDVNAAVASVAHRLNGKSRVVLLANGMGFEDELRRDFAWLDLYSGTTTEGAYRLDARHVQHAGSGHTLLGQAGRETAPDWFDPWSRMSADCSWNADIEQALWRKLSINCAINPLTALHQCRNGQLLERPDLIERLAGVCAEIALVSEAAGYTELAATIEDSVREVIVGTADNQSSMLQDVQRGRPTEIDYITGHLLAVAARHGVAAPLNTELLTEVRQLAD